MHDPATSKSLSSQMCQNCVELHLRKIMAHAKHSFEKTGKVWLHIPTAELCDRSTIKSKRRYRRDFLFPAATTQSNLKLTILVRIIGLILENFTINKVNTVRDVFYQDVKLFRTQRTVISAIDQICRLLHTPRRLLGIVPSPNGLVAGDLTVVFSTGSVVEIDRANCPQLVPVGSQVFHITVKKRPQFILVVEKEAVFAHLHRELPEALVLTGKGFPDHYTRLFLRALVDAMPTIPVYCLVDADVHGILIMKTYSEGSDTIVEEQKPIPRIEYLGVHILDYKRGVVNSTHRDKKLAMSTLKKPWIKEDRFREWRTELQRGLFMGKKAEMNVLDSSHLQALAHYVRNKVRHMQLSKTSARKAPLKPLPPPPPC